MKLLFVLLLAAAATQTAACSSAPAPVSTTADDDPPAFTLPHVPDSLRSPEARAAYLSVHYWDHFDFRDTALISLPEVTEQAFVDFISILPYVPDPQPAADTLVARAARCRPMLDHFMTLADKYLYEPNSPLHNETLYIPLLRAIVACPVLTEAEQSRPRFRLEMALKNRPGDPAADFSFERRDGSRGRLSAVKAPLVLVYFNDPECEDCRRTLSQLQASAALTSAVASGRLAVLSVCVEGRTAAWEAETLPEGWIDACDPDRHLTLEGVYDLKAMPTLYLLDADGRVVLKDCSVEELEGEI